MFEVESRIIGIYCKSLSLSLSAPDLVLRKVISFSDCTVCLDKRNASGKIEFYQDPLLYKCSFRTRLHFTYDNINSKIPAVIKVRAPNIPSPLISSCPGIAPRGVSLVHPRQKALTVAEVAWQC